MKQFLKWILYGAAATLGGMLVRYVIGIFSDPFKKTKIKKKFRKIKDAFTDED